MVRIIVGTLVDIGRGQLEVAEMAAIIASRDRRRAGQTAPPHGLMLWKVHLLGFTHEGSITRVPHEVPDEGS